MREKVLVTGGAGFVGTNLIKKLIEMGYDVVCLDNYSTGKKENHVKGALYYEIDICDDIPFDTFGDIKIVYHLAALARIQPSFKKPTEYFENNIISTVNLAKWCSDKDIPLIFAGSSSHHSGKYKNPYTFTKEVGEETVELFSRIYGLKQSVTRFYNVYGPHQLEDGGYSTVIGKWDKARRENESIIIYGDGSKRRDFTHIDDIVDALIKIYLNKAWGHTFELGRGLNFSLQEVAEMYKNPKGYVYEDDKPGEAQETLCESSLAKELLDWKPKKNLIDWINENNM